MGVGGWVASGWGHFRKLACGYLMVVLAVNVPMLAEPTSMHGIYHPSALKTYIEPCEPPSPTLIDLHNSSVWIFPVLITYHIKIPNIASDT